MLVRLLDTEMWAGVPESTWYYSCRRVAKLRPGSPEAIWGSGVFRAA